MQNRCPSLSKLAVNVPFHFKFDLVRWKRIKDNLLSLDSENIKKFNVYSISEREELPIIRVYPHNKAFLFASHTVVGLLMVCLPSSVHKYTRLSI